MRKPNHLELTLRFIFGAVFGAASSLFIFKSIAYEFFPFALGLSIVLAVLCGWFSLRYFHDFWDIVKKWSRFVIGFRD
jgi:hypothetical protein